MITMTTILLRLCGTILKYKSSVPWFQGGGIMVIMVPPTGMVGKPYGQSLRPKDFTKDTSRLLAGARCAHKRAFVKKSLWTSAAPLRVASCSICDRARFPLRGLWVLCTQQTFFIERHSSLRSQTSYVFWNAKLACARKQA
jgi:hypothetical protein